MGECTGPMTQNWADAELSKAGIHTLKSVQILGQRYQAPLKWQRLPVIGRYCGHQDRVVVGLHSEIAHGDDMEATL